MINKDVEFERICEKKIEEIKRHINGRNIYIWGAGKGGEILERVCKKHEIFIKGFCDRRADEISDYLGYPVISLQAVSPNKDYLIISFMEFYYDILTWVHEIGFSCKDCFYVYENEGYNKEDIVYKGCKIGRYTYGYEELLEFYPIAKSIGRYCSINRTARIWNNHPISYITTHPFLDYPQYYSWYSYESREEYIDKYGKYLNNAEYENSKLRKNPQIIIGNDVWVGANVVLLPGVTIGDGAIIAAGAVVNDDVDPYAIVGGVPAKVIRYRFPLEKIKKLESIKWWDWSIEKIENNIELFFKPEEFLR